MSHPEGTSWGLGSVLPVVGSGPGFVVLNNRPVLQKDLVHEHRFIEDMRLLEDGPALVRALPAQHAAARAHRRAGARLAARRTPSTTATLARLQPLADAVALALRERAAVPEDARAVDHRRGHARSTTSATSTRSLDRELKLVDRYKSVAVAAVHRPRPLQADQRPVRPPARQPHAARGRLPDPRRACARPTIPARYGGDEFVVILPQTDGDSAPHPGREAAASHRGPHLPAGGGDQRPARRLARRRRPIRPRRTRRKR